MEKSQESWKQTYLLTGLLLLCLDNVNGQVAGTDLVGWTPTARDFPDDHPGYIVILDSQPIVAAGYVTEWRFWPGRSFPFKAFVLRPSMSMFEIIGINDIAAPTANQLNTVPVDAADRIQVEADDVIGYAWTDNASPGLHHTQNSANENTVKWFKVDDATTLAVGQTITTTGEGDRVYSFQAQVTNFGDFPNPSPGCLDTLQKSATSASWPVTWLPDCTPELKFSVKMASSAGDGVARLLLASDSTPSTPYFIINLGWDDSQTAPGPADIRSYLGLCTAAELNDGDGSCYDDTDGQRESFADDNGDVSDTGFTEFVLSTTSNGVHVSYPGEEPFMSFTTNEFDPKSIRYVGIQSHYGDDVGGAGNVGENDLVSYWRFCTDDWESLATGKTVSGSPANGADVLANANDGDPTTCYNSGSATDPYIVIDLGEEMDVAGVTYYRDAASTGSLVGSGVFVGSCPVEQVFDNIKCGADVTSDEANNIDNEPVFRDCADDTYGRYVIVNTVGWVQLQVCEIIVHGKPIADADKTTYEFELASYDTDEEVNDYSFDVNIIRSGSANKFTCGLVTISDDTASSSGGAMISADYMFTSATPSFGENDESVTEDDLVTIEADCEAEDTETIVLKLENPTNGGIIGVQSILTINIADDDPIYTFSTNTASVWENDSSGPGGTAKVTLTIERSAFTSSQTIIEGSRVSTMNCGSADSNDYTAYSGGDVTFPPSSTSQTIDIYITKDDGNKDAADNTFCVSFDTGSPCQGDVSPIDTVTITILNDDTVYSFCEAGYSGDESDEEIEVRICRIGKTDTRGCIDVYLEPTEPAMATRATEGPDDDYPPFPRKTITFVGGDVSETISIPINDDTEVEVLESFQITLASPSAGDLTTCGSSDLSPVIGDTDNTAQLDIIDNDAAYSVSSTTKEVLENKESVRVYLERTTTTRSGTITYRIYGTGTGARNVGTSLATEGDDFGLAGTYEATFESGEGTAYVDIPIYDDPLVEFNEEFYVEITGGDSDINQGRKLTRVVIRNNDANFYIQNTERTVLESINSFFAVIQRGPLEVGGVYIPPYLDDDVTISVNTNSGGTLSATEDIDFEGVSKTVTFSGATRDAVRTCAIEIINDQEIEEEESFNVTISDDNVNIDPHRSSSKITIADDDGRITCSVDGETTVSVDEDQQYVTITCTRSGLTNNDETDQSSNRVAVFTLTAFSETARQGYDFNAYSSTLRFPLNVNTITETIDLIKDDLELENPETFRLGITDSDSELDTSSSVIIFTILDNDEQGFQFEETSYTVGESCGALDVTVIRTGTGNIPQGTTLRIRASDGTGNNGAIYPDDYTTQETLISFLGTQQRQVVTFHINSDGETEGSETFTLTLSKVSGLGDVTQSVATITILEQTVIYSVQDTAVTRSEGSGTQALYFVRRGDYCRAAQIYVSTRDGSARSGQDYMGFTSRVVTFNTNSDTAFTDVVILDDYNEERDETFTVEIQGSDIQTDSRVTTLTIRDNDGRVRFSQSEYSTIEGTGSVSLTIEADINATPTEVEVAILSGTAIAGDDYTILSNMFIEFGAGETSQTFSVPIIDDAEDESDETFSVRIASATSGGFGDPRVATVIIQDDDGASGQGLSSGVIIAIAGGAGGFVLFFVVLGICVAVVVIRPRPGAAAAGRPVPYNGAVNYRRNYNYQGYGQPQIYFR